MTASELAFMALGLLLGAASGAALIVLLGTRLPRREIRVTVTRDALPRRSETLSQDAFVTSPAEVARGGPADRRSSDRSDVDPAPAAPLAPATAPVATASAAVAVPIARASGEAPTTSRDRTIVPTGPGRSVSGATSQPVLTPIEAPRQTPPPLPPSSRPPRPRITTTVPIGQAVTAAGILAVEEDAEQELEQARHRRAWNSALERMLRGDHRAMVEVLDRVAGPDSQQRREWELLLGGLVEAMAEVAVRESVIDFPMGTAFWDTFTIEQCRRIVGALATMGFEYDGHDGWMDNRVPAYRDLTLALADVGVDPRRIRAWPNSSDIAALFVGARPAPEELLAAAGPTYEVEDVKELVGSHADELNDLWLAWDHVRPALFEEHLTTA